MTSIISGNSLGLFDSSLSLLGTYAPGGDPQVGRQGDLAYVNGSTGNLVIQQQDEYLAGLGLDLALVRTYNSQGQYDGDNSDNWQLNVYRRIYGLTGTVNTAGSTVTKVFGDGTETLYTYDTARLCYVSTAGAGPHDTLTYQSGTWTWSDGTPTVRESYNSSGQLTALTDADNNTIAYTYTGSLVTSISDSASGQVVYLDYTGNNLTRIRTVSQGVEQTRVYYTYDAQGRLSQVIVDLTPDNNSVVLQDSNSDGLYETVNGQAFVTTYTYDGTSTRVASIRSGDGAIVQFSYVQVAGSWRVASQTDGTGQVTTYTYDTVNRRTTVNDPLGNRTLYSYDPAGRLIEVASLASGGATLTSIVYGYDSAGNLASVTDGNGHTRIFEYDPNGNLTLTRDADGNTVTYTYSTNNQLLTETRYAIADPDGAGVLAPGAPQTTRYAYDSEGHPRFVVSAAGLVTEYRYDTAGHRVAAIAFAGGTYNLAGLNPGDSLSETQLSTWAAGQDLTKTRRTDTAYDFRGNVDRITNYAQVAANGSGVADGTQSVTQFVYDRAGQLLTTIDARGTGTADLNDYRTTYTYDGLGRLLATTQWVETGKTITPVTYAYDDAGNRIVTTSANGLITTTVYDSRGLLLSLSQSGSSGPVLGTTIYLYDNAGHLRATIDPTGVKTAFLYDEAGRLVGTVDGAGALTETVYDAAGNVVRTVRYATPVNPALDPATASLAQLRPAPGSVDRTSRFVYDAANRLVFTIDAEGYVTETRYDGTGRVVEQVFYANAITLASLPGIPVPADIVVNADSVQDRHARRFYDNDGRLTGSLDAEGYLTVYHYDGSGALTETVAYVHASDTALRAAGSLDQLQQSITLQGSSPLDRYTRTFYNAKGQLIGVLDADGYLTEYGYDLAGNRTSETRYSNKANAYATGTTPAQLRPAPHLNDRVVTSIYDGANRTTSVTRLPDGTVTGYVYDDAGRLVSTTTAASTSEARTSQAIYDLQGRMIKTLTGEGSAALAIVLADPSHTQADIDAVWAQYGVTNSYDSAGRLAASTDANGHTTWFYYDQDSRLTYAVNALGEVTETRYNAFGEVTDSFRYSGRISTTGLNGGLVTPDITGRVTAIANSAVDAHTQLGYTLRGAVQQAIDAEFNTTGFTYNAFNEVISKTRPTGASQSVTTFAYDRRGLLTDTYRDTTGLNLHTRSVYDAFGRVAAAYDANGNLPTTIVYGYDAAGRAIVTSTDPLGYQRVTTYDAFGRVLTQVDALGHGTTFQYNDANRSLTITTPEGISTTTITNRHGETVTLIDGNGNTAAAYQYDKNGNITQVTDAFGHTTTTAYDHANRAILTRDANGTPTVFTYDAANRLLTRVVDPQNYIDEAGNSVANSAGLALTTNYSYDGQGRTITVTEKNTVNGVLADRVTQYQYDRLGRRTAEIRDPAGLHITTLYTYDASGNVTSRTDAAGTDVERTTRYVYDAQNRLAYVVDALGGVTHNDYDSNGNLLKTTQYAGAIALAGLGNALTAAQVQAALAARTTPLSADDRVTRYTYDADNRLVFTVDTLGGVSETSYDGNGNITRMLVYANRLNASQMAAIDTNGSNASSSLHTTMAALANPALDHRVWMVYDADNRAIFHIDAAGYVTESQYDNNGNVVRTVAYVNAVADTVARTESAIRTSLNADATQDRVTRHVYDAGNRRVYTIDAQNYVTETVYDDVGRILDTYAYAQSISIGPLPDQQDVATAVALVDNPATDQHTQYAYDAAGRLSGTTDAEGHSESYLYDDLGNKTSFTNKLGNTWTYEYDNLGRLTHEHTPLVAVTRIAIVNGVPQETVSSESLTTAIAYDALGNVTSRTEADGTSEARTTSYEYDTLGRQTRVIYPPVGVYDAATDSAAPSSGIVFTPSANVIGNAWLRDPATNTLVATPGVSIDVSPYLDANGLPLYYADLTPTSVTATVYDSDGMLVGTVSTEVGYDQVGPPVLWNAVSNWNGRVNIALAALDAGTYRVEFVIADDAPQTITYPHYDNTDGTWTRSGSVFVNVGSVNDPVTRVETTQSLDSVTSYDAFGNAVVNRDVGGAYSYKIYDSANRVRYEVDAEHYVTEHVFDAFGNETSLIRYENPLAVLAGRSTPLSSVEIETLLAQAGGSSRTMVKEYDLRNLETRSLQPAVENFDSSATSGSQTFTAGPEIRNTYNAFGQLQRQSVLVNPLSNTWADSYFYYDTLGRRTASVDALGYVTRHEFDAYGNATATTEYAAALAGGTYGLNGYTAPVTTTAQSALGSALGYDRVTRATYDRLNRKTADIRVNVEYAVGSYTGTLAASIQNGDLTTSYGYDALGNLVRVTNSEGNSSYQYYDAIGHKTAATEVARAGETGTTTPLTVYGYDAFGNLVKQTRFANGAASANDATYTAGTPSSADSTSYLRYDAMGRVVQGIDAEGASVYSSYDVYGHVAKTWQPFTDADQVTHHAVTLFTYDAAGRETARTEVLEGGATVVHGTQYDAYGQVTARGTNGGWQEYFDYDNAGRLWRTNSGDGVDRVYLYNLQGKATAVLSSATLDLSASQYTCASEVAVLDNNDLRRTETRYDLLGRVTGETQPWFENATEQGSPVVVTQSFDLIDWASQVQDSEWTVIAPAYINLGWSSLSGFGDGGVRVTVQYKDGTTTKYYTEFFSSAEAQAGVSLGNQQGYAYSSTESAPTVDATLGNISSITKISVWKTIDGQEVLVHEHADDADSTNLFLRQPVAAGDTASLSYRVAGTSTWTNATVTRYGSLLWASFPTTLPVDHYEYQLSYTDPDTGAVYGTTQGDFNVVRGSTSGSANVTGFIDNLSATVTSVVPYSGSGTTNQVSVAWPEISFAEWGSGTVTVTVDYIGKRGDGATSATSKTQTFNANDVLNGATVSWTGGALSYSYKVQSVNRVRVWISVNGTNVLIRDTAEAQNDQLILTGKTTGLTSVNVTGIGNLAVTSLGNGFYAANTGNVANGELCYNPVGTVSTVDGVVHAGASIQDFNTQTELLTPTRSQTVDRWGNVIAATDALGHTTLFRYNSQNALIEETKAAEWVWGENGVRSDAQQASVTHADYDAAGRLLQVTDANGYRTIYRYDAAGQRITEYQGVLVGSLAGRTDTAYDAFGRQVAKTDGIGIRTEMVYDRNDRLTQILRPDAENPGSMLVHDAFGYDEAGHRITHTTGIGDTANDPGDTLRYFYDTRGNVVKIRQPLGEECRYEFDAYGNRAAEHLATGVSQTWEYDYFARLTDHDDLGGVDFNYVYDYTGALTHQTNDRGQNLNYTYAHNGLLANIHDVALGDTTNYQYDAAGQRTRERFTRNGEVITDTHVQYDAQGRIERVEDNRYTLKYRYDAAANRRAVITTYYDVNGKARTVENWYRYDGANRVVLNAGVRENGQIKINSSQGTELGYDLAGNRRTASRFYLVSGSNIRTYEAYDFDSAGRLSQTRIGINPGAGTVTSRRYYDRSDRVVDFYDYNELTGGLQERRFTTYDANGWVRYATIASADGSFVVLDYGDGSYTVAGNTAQVGYDAEGHLLGYKYNSYNNPNNLSVQRYYLYQYEHFDAYQEKKVQGYQSDAGYGHTATSYDVNGHIVQVEDTLAVNDQIRRFTLNADGQIVAKTLGDKVQDYFYVNGRSVGTSGDLAKPNFDYLYEAIGDATAAAPGVYTVQAGDTLSSIALAVYGDASLWYVIADANGLSGNSELTAGLTLTVPANVTSVLNGSDSFAPYDPGLIIGDTTPTLPRPKNEDNTFLMFVVMIIVIYLCQEYLAPAIEAAFAGPASGASATASMAVDDAFMAGAEQGAMQTAVATAADAALTYTVTSAAASFVSGALTGALASAAGQYVGTSDHTVDLDQVWASALGMGIGSAAATLIATMHIAAPLKGMLTAAARNVGSQAGGLLAGTQDRFSWAGVATAAIMVPVGSQVDAFFGVPQTYAVEVGDSTVNLSVSENGMPFSPDMLFRRIGSEMVKGYTSESLTVFLARDGKVDGAQVMVSAFGTAIGNSIVDQMKWSSGGEERVKAANAAAAANGTGGIPGLAAVGLTGMEKAAYIAQRMQEGAIVAAGDGPGIVLIGGDEATINSTTEAWQTEFNTALEAGTSGGRFANVSGDPSTGEYGINFETRGPWSNDPYASWTEVDELPELEMAPLKMRPPKIWTSSEALEATSFTRGLPYKQGYPDFYKVDPATVPLANTGVCNEFPWLISPRLLGETIPYSLADQRQFYQAQGRLSTDAAKLDIMSFIYFGEGSQGHGVTVYNKVVLDGKTYFGVQGAKSTGSESGIFATGAKYGSKESYISIETINDVQHAVGYVVNRDTTGTIIDFTRWNTLPWPNKPFTGGSILRK